MGGCPTGWKIKYGTRSEATTAHRRAKNKTQTLKPYRCPCGFWHLTSMAAADFKRAKRRKAA